VSISNSSEKTIIDIEPYKVDLFDDNGWIEISNETNSDIVKFFKINKKQIVIKDYMNSYSGTITISPYSFGTPPDGKVYAFYTPVMGFDLEGNTYKRKDLSKEITPWFWKSQRTIAVVSTVNPKPYSITLRPIDIPFIKKSIGANVYGPIYSGNELVLLEGEVKSEDNEPINNEEVEVYSLGNIGLLNEERGKASIITDDEGKFYVTLNPNLNRLDYLRFKDSNVTRYSGKTLLRVDDILNNLENIPLSSSGNEELIVYTILKDDGTFGTVGRKHTYNITELVGNPAELLVGKVIDLDARLSNIGNKGIVFYDFLLENEILEYIGGKVKIKTTISPDPSTVYITGTIKDIVAYPDVFWDSGTGTFIYENDRHRISTYAIILESSEEENFDGTGSIESMRLYKKNDIIFDPATLSGRKVVIAEPKNPYIWKHPNADGQTPVYGPVLTGYYNSQTKTYTVNSLLPESSSTDEDLVIAGYALFPNKEIAVQAKLKNNNSIYSNWVKFDVQLNDRDKGVVENILKTVKIPYGFRFYDQYSESSSTLDSSTFLTINVLPGMSFTPNKYPVISYLGSNGIIYLNDNPYQQYSAAADFTIEIN
jgi:hypothetical protein